MIAATGPHVIHRFRAAVAHRLGLHFDDAKLPFLETVFLRRIEAGGRTDEGYLGHLEHAPAEGELAALAQELTVPETYFFRNIDQFRAFAEICLPQRVSARVGNRRLRFLSAGCASGEEPYSIAMLVRELLPDPAWDVSVLGVDVNPAVIDKAIRGRYSPWALRETTPDTQRRWFRMDGRDAILDEGVRTSVRFEQRNLIEEDRGFWRSETYDVVFCRNMLMYLTPAAAKALVARLTQALVPGGYLFLGHAETLRGLSGDFRLCHTHGTFYYQRKDPAGTEAVGGGADWLPSQTEGPPALVSAFENAGSWVEVIRDASERIQALVESSPTPSAPHTPAPPRPGPDLGAALDLLRRERFGDALELVRLFPSDAARDPDVLILHAVLLTHRGELGEAERLCRDLLQIDELNAGAHYILALGRESVGDFQGAADQDQMAAYLDPDFAMPRLHLGLLARKRNDREAARRELAQALALLRREDAPRLLFFGGGFGRDALLALCEAELIACGGRR